MKEYKKFYCSAHPAQGSTNTHPHLNHREGMETWEKMGPTSEVRNEIRKKGNNLKS